MDLRKLGCAVKTARLSIGMSQDGLAAESGVARSAVHRIEMGTTNPTVATVWALADSLKLNPSDLLYEAESDRTQRRAKVDLNMVEAGKVLIALAEASPATRLCALYVLTNDRTYLDDMGRLGERHLELAEKLRNTLRGFS
jgi:transcriptional regulator with XRE-family HTH domain